MRGIFRNWVEIQKGSPAGAFKYDRLEFPHEFPGRFEFDVIAQIHVVGQRRLVGIDIHTAIIIAGP